MAKIPIPSAQSFTLENLHNEFNKVIEKFWHAGVSTPPLDGQDWAPDVELREEPQSYRAVIELPGIRKEAVQVTLQGASLLIQGEKINPHAEDVPGSRLLRNERRYGSFKREIPLPGGVQGTGIVATMADGVLEIVVPKTPPVEPMTVEVRITDANPQS